MGNTCGQPSREDVHSPSGANAISNTLHSMAYKSENKPANSQKDNGGNASPGGGTTPLPAAADGKSDDDTTAKGATGANAATAATTGVADLAAGSPYNSSVHATGDEEQRINFLMRTPELRAITPEVVRIIRETWGLALKRPGFAVAFYNHLLTKHRSMTEAIFYGVDIVQQAGRLVKMIDGAIDLLERPKSLVPVMIRLGSRHVAYGTTSQHFTLVTTSLIDLILETVGPAIVTPEVVGHWHLVLGVFEAIMEAGATTTAGKLVGRKHHSRIQRTLLKCWKSTINGHNRQLRSTPDRAHLPDMDLILAAASAQKSNPSATPQQATAQTAHLFFGVPASISEAMLSRAMQQFIINGGDSPSDSLRLGGGGAQSGGEPAIMSPTQTNGAAAADFENVGSNNRVQINHLLAPSLSALGIAALASVNFHGFDQLIARAFEVGLNNIEENMPLFEKSRRHQLELQRAHRASNADGSLPPPLAVLTPLPPNIPKTLHASEALYNSLQATGREFSSPVYGFRRGDLESFNDSFVKSTLFFASPEWNNPFVRDEMARFWMKFCSYIPINNGEEVGKRGVI